MSYDIQPEEKKTIIEAGKEGGKYLQSINKYDFSSLSKAEWEGFLETIIMYYEHNKIPF